MAGNTYGQVFRVHTWGASHGSAIGAVIDGCPAGLELSEDDLQRDLDRRRPGQSALVTQRKEADRVEILSGVFEGKTTGTPISLIIKNKDQKSRDYDHIKDVFRPSHADYTYTAKYGHRDYRGGGRSSARETAARVAAAGIAKKLLSAEGVNIRACVDQVGSIQVNQTDIDWSYVEENILRIGTAEAFTQAETLIKNIRKEGNTIGGSIYCEIDGCPVGLGEPVFDKLHADLAKAMMSINATRGFEIGSGFAAISMKGSEHNDLFYTEDDIVKTKTNHSGGIQGGISNGQRIYFRVAFKPVATIMQNQATIDNTGSDAVAAGKGRHDPCVVPRAVPIVEAMAALTLADHYLRHRNSRL